MLHDFSTIKTSTLYFPKLHVVRAKNYKKLNCFLKRSENNIFKHKKYFANEKIKTDNYLINSFQMSKQNYPKTPPHTYINKIQTPLFNYKMISYNYKESIEANKRVRKINGIFLDFHNKKKNNTKLKNQGITTCDSFFVKKKSQINHRYLTLGKNENNMDNLSSFSNNTMKEFFINSCNKLYKHRFSLNRRIPLKVINDKYAYIYMSDKSELIKHWRRANYNPLNV